MFMVRKLSGNISRAEFNFSKISFNFIGFVIDDKAYHFFSVAHKVKFNLQKGWTRSEIGFEIIYSAKKKKKETWTARGCKTCISEKEFLIYFWTPARTGTNKKRETERERERERGWRRITERSFKKITRGGGRRISRGWHKTFFPSRLSSPPRKATETFSRLACGIMHRSARE